MLEKKYKHDNLVKIHEIKNYDNLLDFINVDETDLREKFIFRGLKKSDYTLVPSSLRKTNNNQYEINKFIKQSEFKFHKSKMKKMKMDGEEGLAEIHYTVDKNNTSISQTSPYEISSDSELHFKREIYVLLKFLDYADKIGLKISASTSIRNWIHNYLSYENEKDEFWPKPEFYEIISLAQHNGLPTRALDWSYDFKVALFFATSDVLNNNNDDCILWAFNYKIFEEHYQRNEKEKLIIYRPEYNVNSNLKAQKGLFTFLTSENYENIDDDTPFDEYLINNLKEIKCINSYNYQTEKCYKLDGLRGFKLDDNEKIFHKFVINGNLKAKILKELYLDGYAYENIYPSYCGVTRSIRKRATLDKLLNEE